MKMLRTCRFHLVTVVAISMVSPGLIGQALAHCDSLDGPIVPEARDALTSGDITAILKWVRAEDEAVIREAFGRTVTLRDRGEDVREMADQYFLETLIRIHRAGEGAPYTGLKPVGSMAPAFAAADAALEAGEVDELADRIAEAVRKEIKERFAVAYANKQHADHNVTAGREFVASYVTYVHFIEGLHGFLAEGDSGHHAPPVVDHDH